MRFDIEGETFVLHTVHEIRHDALMTRPDTRVTRMALHSGPCTETRPCGAAAATSEARCHEGDQYVKVVGNKLAFERVVAHYPRIVRMALWKNFWMHHNKPRG